MGPAAIPLIAPFGPLLTSVRQIGMFAYTGLKPEQMDKLAKEVGCRSPPCALVTVPFSIR